MGSQNDGVLRTKWHGPPEKQDSDLGLPAPPLVSPHDKMLLPHSQDVQGGAHAAEIDRGSREVWNFSYGNPSCP